MGIPVLFDWWTGRKLLGIAGFTVLFAALGIAVLVPLLGPDPGQQHLNRILDPPAISQLMGMDQLGRDQFSRVAVGVQHALLTMLVVLAVSGLAGGLIGVVSGYFGGHFDLFAQRVIDAVMALPLVVLALGAIAAAGASFWTITLVIGVAFTPLSARVARSSAMLLRGSGYVDAARISGASHGRVIARHIIPNAIGPWAIVVASQAGAAILAEAALAFLGMGAHVITLGGLLAGETQAYMHGAPWLVVWPGVTLALLVVAVNLVGEWVSEWFAIPRTASSRVSRGTSGA